MAPNAGLTGVLRPGEEEWQKGFEQLCERFPTVNANRVAQALRSSGGHGGTAAAELRDLTSSKVKEADPDDVEHVATLLSSPVMFKHACKEKFAKFDKNGDGVLDFGEVLQLTHELYAGFGLQEPSEGALRAFFDATDENKDGVLTEREFRKFFECFLRYAFFDVAKLRQLVSAQTSGGTPPPIVGSKPQQQRHSAPSVPVQQQPKPKSRSPERRRSPDEGEVQSRKPAGGGGRGERDGTHASRRDEEQHGGHRGRRSDGVSALKCVAPNGVAFRRSPCYDDRCGPEVTAAQAGDVVRVLEHWVRTSKGWLPIAAEGNTDVLFQPTSKQPRDEERALPPRAAQAAPTPQGQSARAEVEAAPSAAAHAGAADGDASGRAQSKPQRQRKSQPPQQGLTPDEEEWREVFSRLCERFLEVDPQHVVEALRANGGHAGKAATVLRNL